MKIYPHWDVASMLIYILMGIIGATAINIVNKYCADSKCSVRNRCFLAYMAWGLIWTCFAAFRYVAKYIGGMDALAYIKYFEVCLAPGDYWYADHVGALYRLVNKAVRVWTSDYHVMFIFIYGFIVVSYIVFVEEFRFSKMNCIPLILIVYLYIRGFCTIRTNLGAACVLLSLVFLHRKNWFISILFAAASVLFQVASLIYAGFLPFFFFYKKKCVKLYTCIFWIMAAAAVGRIGQYVIANYDLPFLSHGAYRWYAVYSQQGQTFFTNFWKIAFSQMLLGAALAYLWDPLKKDITDRADRDAERISFIKLICAYDLILIPVTYILGIWRGYEYLYIPRLMLWAELIPLFKKRISFHSKTAYDALLLVMFVAWMVFRQYNTWEDSGLMPYVFEPLLTVMK